jgi:aldehyde:ferredoxin oxidoreductase
MNEWRILSINLANGQWLSSPARDEWATLGGRAFTSHAVSRFVAPTCDPLGAENVIAISTGLLANSRASSTFRISIGAKSPLTGGIKESNSGGTAGAALTSLGIRGIFLKNNAAEWTTLLITPDGVSFIPAAKLVGLNTYEVTKKLLAIYGRQAAVLSIGPAGENLLPTACIGVTDIDGIPARHAARGGLGAVMGSKKIKAIVVIAGKQMPAARDESALAAARKRFNDALLKHPTSNEVLRKYGTAFIIDVVNKLGGLPTRNYHFGQFEHADKINGEALYQTIVARHGKYTHACMPGCVVCCSNVIPDKNGRELNRALEFETITLLGANLGIGDLDAICELNRLCDEIGVDTIETGAALGVMMEAGLAAFGDSQKVIALVKEIGEGTPTGKLLGSGATATGRSLNISHVPAVRGQAMAAYDPRALKGTGVTYATSPMGADHTAGNVLPGSKLPDGSIPNPSLPEKQIELSRYTQAIATMFDFLGLCWLAKPPVVLDLSLVIDLLNAVDDEKWDLDKVFLLAEQTLQKELEFNQAAGLSISNDLPEFFRKEALPPFNYLFDVEKSQLDHIHNLRIKDL